MCVFKILHLVYRVLPDFPGLCIQPMALIWCPVCGAVQNHTAGVLKVQSGSL